MTERAKASKLTFLPVTGFVQNVASRSPTPGGGSVAALSGSMGAGLITMVCRLSGAKQGEELREFFRESEQKAIELRDRLRDLTDADAEAYEAVVAAMGLDQSTSDRAEARKRAVDEANRRAAEVPFETMGACLRGLELLEPVVDKCFKGAITDAGVAGLVLEAGFMGAMYNVQVNLPGVADTDFTARTRSRMQRMVPRMFDLAAGIRRVLAEKLGG